MSDDVIRSDRLDLRVLTPRLLRLTRHRAVADLEAELDARLPAEWCPSVPARQRLAQLAADPAAQPWLVRAVVHRDQRDVVGHVGFHGPPRRGRVEIGYEIMPGHQRKGYAREAAQALLDWAAASGRVQVCMACIRPDNTASLGLAAQLGFLPAGRRRDAQDGILEVHERPVL